MTLLGSVAAIVFAAGGAYALFRLTRKDVNGLGKKYWRNIAFLLRMLAEEKPISREKLLHLADLIEPK